MDRARRGARCQAVNEGALQRSTQVKHIMERCVATFHSMFHSFLPWCLSQLSGAVE